MAGRLIDLAVRARRRITPTLTQFSFRLAFVIDLAYVGMGALGGAAVARAAAAPAPAPRTEAAPPAPAACVR